MLALLASIHGFVIVCPGGILQGGLVSALFGSHFAHLSIYLAKSPFGEKDDVRLAGGILSEGASQEYS